MTDKSEGIAVNAKTLQDLLALMVPAVTAIMQFMKDERSYEVVFLSIAFILLYMYVKSLLARIEELKVVLTDEVAKATSSLDSLRKRHDTYAQISNASIANLFSDLSSMAGERTIGSLSVHTDSGALQYIKAIPPGSIERRNQGIPDGTNLVSR